mgnify:CR=1 FL=1
MARMHLMEFHDQTWYPRQWRDEVTDMLALSADVADPYVGVVQRIAEVFKATGSERFVDLCAGGTGPWRSMLPHLERHLGRPPEVVLTDLFPNLNAFARAETDTVGAVRGVREPIDATAVPEDLTGFRTVCAAFHHFAPDLARAILEDAVAKRQPIVILEMTSRTPLAMLGMAAIPFFAAAITPWAKPMTLGRLLRTYVMPVLPATLMVDGFVSCLRSYSPKELRDLVVGLDAFEWEIGGAWAGRVPLRATYLLGWPRGGR